jgi:cob(I)alamin adenosyltransferase
MGFNRNGSPGEKGGERLKIYTKTGDAGETGLFGGGRTSKDSPRVAAYGEVDELNAALGLARALGTEQFADSLLETVQRDLFTIGAELATPDPDKLHKVFAHGRAAIGDSGVAALEQAIDEQESRLEPLKHFILPGGTPQAAALHLGRTVCRRAERAVVAVARHERISPAILRYLNRLSDLLFVLARAANAHAGRPDVKW